MTTPISELAKGTNVAVRWEVNPKQPGMLKANHFNGKRSNKIILPTPGTRGIAPKAGELWICSIERITNPQSKTHGAVIVKPLAQQIDGDFPGVWIDPVKARLMSIVLQDPEKNLMLEGDQGVGKSTISHAVAKKLGWEFRRISGNAIKKFNFMLGRYCSVPKDGEMAFVWRDSKLVEVLREALRHPDKEYLLMVDEYTRIDEDARDILLDVIEGQQRVLRLPTGEDIPISKNVHFMGAGNVGGSFTLKAQDAAAKSRWVIIKVEHMPQDAELKHCMEKYTACSEPTLLNAIITINKVRQSRSEPAMRLTKTICTRSVQNVALFLSHGIDIETAMLTAVVNQYPGTFDDSTSEAGRVWKTISDELKKLGVTKDGTKAKAA